MIYEEFIDGIEKYWELFENGLKKQANKYLFDFAERFKTDVSQEDGDKLLYRFCSDYLDGDRFGDFAELCAANGVQFHAVKAYYYE